MFRDPELKWNRPLTDEALRDEKMEDANQLKEMEEEEVEIRDFADEGEPGEQPETSPTLKGLPHSRVLDYRLRTLLNEMAKDRIQKERKRERQLMRKMTDDFKNSLHGKKVRV
jgi:hypothetical protein